MTFEEIYEILRHSMDFEEFQINYNELIPDIVKAKNTYPEDWINFIRFKNECKDYLYDKFCIEYKFRIIRSLRLLKNVYDYDITDEIEKTETAFKPYFKFKHKLDLLR